MKAKFKEVLPMFRKAKAAEGAQILPWHQTFAVGIIMSMLAGYLEAYTYTCLLYTSRCV